VPGQHDVLAGERAREPAGELRCSDAVGAERRRAGRLFPGGALEVCSEKGVARGNLVAEQFQQPFTPELALQLVRTA
jgi:hypothetical protein